MIRDLHTNTAAIIKRCVYTRIGVCTVLGGSPAHGSHAWLCVSRTLFVPYGTAVSLAVEVYPDMLSAGHWACHSQSCLPSINVWHVVASLISNIQSDY